MRRLIFLSIGVLFLFGCATTSFNNVNNEINKEDKKEIRKEGNKEIKLERVTIHIVNSSQDFDNPKFKGSPTVKGYANGFEVWIVASFKNGQIYIDSKLLGHEIRHMLKARQPELTDPDKEDYLSVPTRNMASYKLPWN